MGRSPACDATSERHASTDALNVAELESSPNAKRRGIVSMTIGRRPPRGPPHNAGTRAVRRTGRASFRVGRVTYIGRQHQSLRGADATRCLEPTPNWLPRDLATG